MSLFCIPSRIFGRTYTHLRSQCPRILYSSALSETHPRGQHDAAEHFLETLKSRQSVPSQEPFHVSLGSYLQHRDWKLKTKQSEAAPQFEKLLYVFRQLEDGISQFDVQDAFECLVLLSDFKKSNPLPPQHVKHLLSAAESLFKLMSANLVLLTVSQVALTFLHAGQLKLRGDIIPFLCDLRAINFNPLSSKDLVSLHIGLMDLASQYPDHLTQLEKFVSRPETYAKLDAYDCAIIAATWFRFGSKHMRLLQTLFDHAAQPQILNKVVPDKMLSIVEEYYFFENSDVKFLKSFGYRITDEKLLSKLDARLLSGIVWGLAKLKLRVPDWFHAVGDHILSNDVIKSFKAEDLSLTAWSFVAAGQYHPLLMARIAEQVCPQGSTLQLAPRVVGELMWAFAQHGEDSKRLLRALAKQVAQPGGLEGYTKGELGSVAWSLAAADLVHDKACAALLRALRDLLTSSTGDKPKNFRATHQFLTHVVHHAGAMPCTAALLPSCQGLLLHCRSAFVQQLEKRGELNNAIANAVAAISGRLATHHTLQDAGGITITAFCVERKLAIVAESRGHYLLRRDGKWVPQGSALMRRRHLNWHGIQVVPVPFFEWNDLKTARMKEQYLRRLLSQSS